MSATNFTARRRPFLFPSNSRSYKSSKDRPVSVVLVLTLLLAQVTGWTPAAFAEHAPISEDGIQPPVPVVEVQQGTDLPDFESDPTDPVEENHNFLEGENPLSPAHLIEIPVKLPGLGNVQIRFDTDQTSGQVVNQYGQVIGTYVLAYFPSPQGSFDGVAIITPTPVPDPIPPELEGMRSFVLFNHTGQTTYSDLLKESDLYFSYFGNTLGVLARLVSNPSNVSSNDLGFLKDQVASRETLSIAFRESALRVLNNEVYLRLGTSSAASTKEAVLDAIVEFVPSLESMTPDFIRSVHNTLVGGLRFAESSDAQFRVRMIRALESDFLIDKDVITAERERAAVSALARHFGYTGDGFRIVRAWAHNTHAKYLQVGDLAANVREGIVDKMFSFLTEINQALVQNIEPLSDLLGIVREYLQTITRVIHTVASTLEAASNLLARLVNKWSGVFTNARTLIGAIRNLWSGTSVFPDGSAGPTTALDLFRSIGLIARGETLISKVISTLGVTGQGGTIFRQFKILAFDDTGTFLNFYQKLYLWLTTYPNRGFAQGSGLVVARGAIREGTCGATNRWGETYSMIHLSLASACNVATTFHHEMRHAYENHRASEAVLQVLKRLFDEGRPWVNQQNPGDRYTNYANTNERENSAETHEAYFKNSLQAFQEGIRRFTSRNTNVHSHRLFRTLLEIIKPHIKQGKLRLFDNGAWVGDTGVTRANGNITSIDLPAFTLRNRSYPPRRLTFTYAADGLHIQRLTIKNLATQQERSFDALEPTPPSSSPTNVNAFTPEPVPVPVGPEPTGPTWFRPLTGLTGTTTLLDADFEEEES